MKKILISFLLSISFLFGFTQEETHVFTTYDTLINAGYAGITWRVRISRPTNMFANHPDSASRPAFVFIPGQGEMGTNYAKLQTFGPHYWLNNGWDGGVQLANGKHFPILITIISSNTFMTGREVNDVMNTILNIYHIKRNSVHGGGYSQGAFATTASIWYELTPGALTGMRKFTSLVACLGASSDPLNLGNNNNRYGGASPGTMNAWSRWATDFGGKFMGFEGTADNGRQVWRVSEPMNDSIFTSPDPGYFGWENIASGAHSGTGIPNEFFNIARTNWQSVTPYGTNMTSNIRATTMGGYQNGWSVPQWMLRQGDTTLVGTAALTINAGSDVTLLIPTQTNNVARKATYDLAGKILTSIVWTRTSGPSGPTINTNVLGDSMYISSLVAGDYFYRATITATDASTAFDEYKISVTDAGTLLPTVVVVSANPDTLASSSGSVDITATPGTGAITEYKHSPTSKPGLAKPIINVLGSSTLAGQNTTTYDSSWYGLANREFRVNGLADSIFRNTTYSDIFSADISTTVRQIPNTKIFVLHFPSNSYTLANNTATIAKMQQFKDTCTALGIYFYAFGPHPRDGYSLADRNNLVYLDSLEEVSFPGLIIHTIDYLRDSLQGNIYRSLYDAFDFFHMNNAGHRQLFNSFMAFNILRQYAAGGSTITNPAIADAAITGMGDGTHKFIVGVRDPSKRSAYAHYTKVVNPVAPVRFTHNTSNGTITFSRSIYPTFKAGDTLYIPKRATGTGYDATIFDRMRSEFLYPDSSHPEQFLIVQFAPDAYMSQLASDNFASYMDSCHGIKIIGLKAINRNAMMWRLGKPSGVNSGYSDFIWIDSAKTVRSLAFENAQYGGFTTFAGDSTKTFHHWYITRTIYQNTYSGNYTAYFFKGGSAFGDAGTSVWRDIGFKYCVADTNYAGESGGSTNGSGGMIAFLACQRVYIHHCTFGHMGMANYPSAHSAVLTLRGTWDVQFNYFGPENHANDVRSQIFNFGGWGSLYTGTSIFANNIVYNKRKYPVVENADPSSSNTEIVPYRTNRKFIEIYNNLLFRGAIGARGAAGAALQNVAYRRMSMLDELTADSIKVYDNLIVGPPRDSVGDLASVKVITTSATQAYVDTTANLTILDPNNVGWIDTLLFKIANTSSALYNKGTSLLPNVIKFGLDYYGNSRSSGGLPDIGPHEYLVGGNQSPLVDAGSGQTIQQPLAQLTLTGTGSDPDGTISTKTWVFISGPIGAVPSITTPSGSFSSGVTNLTLVGSYAFEFTVTDNGGQSSSDQVTVSVIAANLPPIADAGVNQSLRPGEDSCDLFGGGTDPDGGTITGYNWVLVSKPVGASDPTIVTPSGVGSKVRGFTTVGSYVFKLTVTDNGAANGSANVTINTRAAIADRNTRKTFKVKAKVRN